MQVCVVTWDAELRDLVVEVAGPTSLVVPPGASVPAADVYLWDFTAESSLPGSVELAGANVIFLVAREDLALLAARQKETAFTTLLKPISRLALDAALATQRTDWSNRAGAQSLRSDRDVLLQHVLQANFRLREYDQERTNFLARALHDLRTPLTAIHGFCALLLEGKAGPLRVQQEDLLGKMYKSTRRLIRLSKGMFELSVEGRVKRTLHPEAVEIEACVDQALHELSPVAVEKRLRMITRIEPTDCALYAEGDLIEQLLLNLMENACKFTPRSSEIEIHGYPVLWDAAHPEGLRLGPSLNSRGTNAYRIDIRDSGPGIESEALNAIFEQYTSFGGSDDRSGGGLGLAIAKRIVSAHGGRIWASSAPEGATLSFILPLEPRISGRRLPVTEDTAPRARIVGGL